MAKRQNKWTPEQKHAVVDAVTQHDMTTMEAYQAARAGTLPAKLPPFQISLSTVRTEVTTHNREARLQQGAGLDYATRLRRDAAQLIADLRRARQAELKKHKPLEPEQIIRLAKANQEVVRLVQALGASGKKTPKTPVETPSRRPEGTANGKPENQEAPDFLDELATPTSPERRPNHLTDAVQRSDEEQAPQDREQQTGSHTRPNDPSSPDQNPQPTNTDERRIEPNEKPNETPTTHGISHALVDTEHSLTRAVRWAPGRATPSG